MRVKKLSVWLQTEVKGKKRWLFCAKIVVLGYVYAILSIFFLSLISSEYERKVDHTVFDDISLLYAPTIFFIAAMTEEVFFRMLPFWCATHVILILTFNKRNDYYTGIIWCVTIIISSIPFGIVHISARGDTTLLSVLLIQAVLGASYCVVYLKCGGGNIWKMIQGWRVGLWCGVKTEVYQTIKALFCSTIVHCCYNLMLFYPYRFF